MKKELKSAQAGEKDAFQNWKVVTEAEEARRTLLDITDNSDNNILIENSTSSVSLDSSTTNTAITGSSSNPDDGVSEK